MKIITCLKDIHNASITTKSYWWRNAEQRAVSISLQQTSYRNEVFFLFFLFFNPLSCFFFNIFSTFFFVFIFTFLIIILLLFWSHRSHYLIVFIVTFLTIIILLVPIFAVSLLLFLILLLTSFSMLSPFLNFPFLSFDLFFRNIVTK